jgi:hypothetical protein
MLEAVHGRLLYWERDRWDGASPSFLLFLKLLEKACLLFLKLLEKAWGLHEIPADRGAPAPLPHGPAPTVGSDACVGLSALREKQRMRRYQAVTIVG